MVYFIVATVEEENESNKRCTVSSNGRLFFVIRNVRLREVLIGGLLFDDEAGRYGWDERTNNAKNEVNERETARLKEHNWMVEQLQEMEAMLASVEATCEVYRLGCDDRSREVNF